MHLQAFILLLFPGFISVGVLWRNKKIAQGDYFLVACDYAVYTFLILLSTYGYLFFTLPERTVSFSPGIFAVSYVINAGFVFQYGVASLISSLVLPAFVPWVVRVWRLLEDGRKRKK